jgi:hypothetical protein
MALGIPLGMPGLPPIAAAIGKIAFGMIIGMPIGGL